ncbi:phosphoribosyltransferase [Synechocystis sp. PCC 7509]|uniref:phosphoribosyltransferase n=1 Tax=Synechocystis sp. PCC 7509 TaxID=927677 RepID=UPI0002AC44DB|nr:phosphoribosyltransferase family protein [Synechocystis sp. PCC 7509]
MSTPLFSDRTDAGIQLAEAIYTTITQLSATTIMPPQVVYALPRGGLPVALPVARLLKCPLSAIVAKKITHPKNTELAIGAVTAQGDVLWEESRIPKQPQHRQALLNTALATAKFQDEQFSPACPDVNLTGAIAIIVDDGIATGLTMAVAAQSLRIYQPAAIWLCAPVAPASLLPWLQTWGDVLVILNTPEPFFSVSNFYDRFEQVPTEEAIACLRQQTEW